MLDKIGAPAHAGAPALAFDFLCSVFKVHCSRVAHVCWKQAAVPTAECTSHCGPIGPTVKASPIEHRLK